MSLTVGSCFAGIGGLDLGLERAGMRVAWQVERDPFCLKVLAKHWPNIRRHDDINTSVDAGLDPVDLICGGVPCQPWSVAGKRKGQDDERDLWPAFWRLCLHLRPRFVLVEEVPGFAVPGGLGRAITDIARAGYDAEWFHLSAADVGAPHRRRRLFVVADAEGEGLENRRQAGSQASEGSEVWRTPRSRSERRSRAWWQVEPDVGGTLDGFSSWLVGRGLTAVAHERIIAYGNEAKARPEEVLREVWNRAYPFCLEWETRGFERVPPEAVLLAYMRELARERDEERASLASAKATQVELRSMLGNEESPGTSRGSESGEQRAEQRADALQVLSRLLARDAEKAWLAYRRSDACLARHWESGVARVAHAVPARVDRLRSLGNAVVPQVAEVIGRRILQAVKSEPR